MANATHALVFDDVSEYYWKEGYCERALGLITIPDLNKPPLRALVYMLLARLETCIGRVVRDGYADPMEWVDRIEDSQQRQRIIDYWRQSELDRVNVGPEAGATLTELLRAAGAKPELCRQLGYDSRSQLKKATAPVVDIRNQIMHPVRPLVTARAGALNFGRPSDSCSPFA